MTRWWILNLPDDNFRHVPFVCLLPVLKVYQLDGNVPAVPLLDEDITMLKIIDYFLSSYKKCSPVFLPSTLKNNIKVIWVYFLRCL